MEGSNAKGQLVAFLSSFEGLSSAEVDELAALIPVVHYKRGTVLNKPGVVPNACYFVLNGLVRQYQYVDGTERTTAFYSEAHGTVSSKHFTDQTPSTFFLECMEDSLLIEGTLEINEAHLVKFPVLREITRHMLENDLNKAKEQFTQFILLSPKERYQHFLETRTDIANRVPLHQIASYLGMTPESLSRIRKRLVSPAS